MIKDVYEKFITIFCLDCQNNLLKEDTLYYHYWSNKYVKIKFMPFNKSNDVFSIELRDYFSNNFIRYIDEYIGNVMHLAPRSFDLLKIHTTTEEFNKFHTEQILKVLKQE
jgi:hypothetical protein